MFTYTVSIPGQGDFDVESPEKLTDYQAYLAVQQQMEQQPAPPAKPEGGFFPAIKRGALQTGMLLGDVLPAMVARGFGADEYAEKQLKEAAETQARIQREVPAAVPSFTDISSLGDAWMYAKEAVGESLVSLIPSLLTGGAAGLLARPAVAAANQAAKEAAERTLISAAMKAGPPTQAAIEKAKKEAVDAGIKAAQRTALKYEAVGGLAGSAAQNIPEVYQNILEETGKESIPAALIAGGFNAALDSILPISLLAKMRKQGLDPTEVVGAWYKRGAQGLGKGFLIEGATESAQEASSIAAENFVGENKEFFTPKNLERVINAGLKGGLGGGVITGVSDIALGKGPEPQESDRETAERLQREILSEVETARAEQLLAEQEAAEKARLEALRPPTADEIVDLARAENGYGRLESVKQRLLNQEKTPEVVEALKTIRELQNRIVIEEQQRRAPSIPAEMTDEVIRKTLGFAKSENPKSVYQQLIGKSTSDPDVLAFLRNYADTKAAPQTKLRIEGFLERAGQTPLTAQEIAQGERDAGQALGVPGGAGVAVAGEPSAGAAAPGVGVTQPTGVVPPVEAVEQSDVRKGTEQPSVGQIISIPQTPRDAVEQHAVQGYPIVEAPLNQLSISMDVPQFKSDADKRGIVKPLEGKFERIGVAPIQLWRRLDGRLEVISGRHRFDLAQRTGETTIPAQIHDEASGFGAAQAATLDAELNIRDEQGEVKDYVVYFENSGISEADAKSRGLLGRTVGQRGWAIASKGSPELIAAHRSGVVPDDAAAGIATLAPNDSRIQAVGLRAVQDNKSTPAVLNTVQAVQALATERGAPREEAGDLFGFDDSAIKEAEEMARIATDRQRSITSRLSAITGAANKPAVAKAEGIDIKDEQALNKRIQELKNARAAWNNWSTNPTLIKEIRDEMQGISPIEPELPAELGKPSLAPSPPPKPVKLSKETEAKITELGKVLQRILGKFGLKNVALSIEQDLRVNGEYANRLIKLALDADSPVRDLRHESLHAMKELGFFSDAQWKTLEKFARDKWIDKYLKNRVTTYNGEQMSRYDAYMRLYNGSEDAVIEEAIADAFGDFDITKPPAGLMQTLLRRMRDLFRGIKESMGIANIDTAEDIFRRVEKGELQEGVTVGAPAKASLREVPLSTRGLMEAQPIVAMQELGLKTDAVRKPGGIDLYNDVRSIALALNQETIDQRGKIDVNDTSALARDKLAKAMVDEIGYQLRATAKTGTGKGWYSENYPNAVKKLGKLYPELETDPYARTVFSALVAITSNGEKVALNVKNAIKLYDDIRMGKDPSNVGSRRQTALDNNVSTVLALMNQYGRDGMRNELMREITVKDMNALLRSRGEEPDTSYLANTKIPASAIYFGPKLGAFFSNLEGAEGYLTMDMWWTRTVNRMRGQLESKATAASINKFRELMGQPNATREEVIAATIPLRNKYEEFGWQTELEHLVGRKEPAKTNEKAAWTARAKRQAGPAYQALLFEHRLEKMANTIYKNEYEMLEEAPFTANDREFMYRTARRAQTLLKEDGINLSLADIQAALWYYEKRLYQHLSGRKADDIGYDEAITQLARESDRPARPAVVFGGQPVRGDESAREGAGVAEVRGGPAKFSLKDSIGLYSELENKIAQGPNKAAAPAWKAYINALPQKGVKPEEIEWSGVRDWLDLQTGPITKDAVNAYLKQGGVRVEETVLKGKIGLPDAIIEDIGNRFWPAVTASGLDVDVIDESMERGDLDVASLPSELREDAQILQNDLVARRSGINKYGEYTLYGQHTLPGGENYREVLLTLPNKKADRLRELDLRYNRGEKLTLEERQERHELLRDEAAKGAYQSSHWEKPNVLAHIRLNDRTDRDGKRVLFVEEIQSDWGQAAKKSGFNDGPVEAPMVEPGERENLISLMQKQAQDRMIEAGVDAKQARDVINRLGHDILADASGMKEQYDDLIRRETEDRNRQLQRERAVPRGPFIGKTEGWLNLALKRLMVMAAAGGYDKVAFITGAQSHNRFPEKASGESTKESFKAFYDQIVPIAVKKLMPKVGGGQMEDVNLLKDSMKKYDKELMKDDLKILGEDGFRAKYAHDQQPGFAVTPDMQRKVETTGLPRFSLREDLGPRMNLRAQIDPAINARIDQTTFQRPEKGFIGRMMEAISPKNFSSFRASFLNRYNYLSEIDKEKVRLMGGKYLLADASAESAALLSDLGAGITASAMGVNDRRGGAPVYKRYFVVEVNNRSLAQQYTTRAAAQAAAAKVNGVVRERGFTTVSTFNDTVKGPVAILAPLLSKYKDPHIFRTFQFYSGVKRGARFMYTTNTQGQVVEKLFDPADIQKAQQIEKQFPEFVQAHKEWIAYNDKLVDFLMDTGVLSKERADIYKMHGDYFPFYRQLDEDADALGPKVFQSIAAVRPPKKLKGGEERLGDFFENFVRNTQSAVQAGVKNIASRRAADVGMDVGIVRPLPQGVKTGGPTQFTVLEDGEIKHYESKDMLFINAIKSLNLPDMPGIGIFSGPANLLRNLVTKDPGFILANLMRDSMSAWVTSGVKMTPIADTVANFGKSLFTNNKEFNALLDAGIIGGYEFSQNVETSAKKFGGAIRKAAGVPTLTQQIARPVTSVWDALERATTASDAATRMEIYKKTLAETGNEAEALFRSLEVMNFNRKGSSGVIRILTAAVPFLNARIQGLDLLYRAGINPMLDKSASDRAKEIQKTFFVRGAMIMGLSAAYWALTHDDEDYKKQEQETRDNYWLLPSLGIKIPIPFEIGVIFKVIPERILGYTMGTDTGKDFLDSMKRQLLNTLAFNPIPQAFIPIVETVTDFSFFTWRSILPQGMENVAPQYQVGPGTSKVAEWVGKTIGASPIKIDQLINGYTGTMGMYAVDLVDAIFNTMTDSPKPSKRFEQMPVIRRFAVDPEARGTVTAYYDLKNAVDQVVRTMNLLEKSMDYEGYGEYMQENMKLLAARDYVLDMEKTLKELRESKNTVRVSTMDADAKRDSLTTIGQIENGLTSNIQDLKKIFR